MQTPVSPFTISDNIHKDNAVSLSEVRVYEDIMILRGQPSLLFPTHGLPWPAIEEAKSLNVFILLTRVLRCIKEWGPAWEGCGHIVSATLDGLVVLTLDSK